MDFEKNKSEVLKRLNIKKIVLFLFCIYSLFFFVGSSLSPILAHFQQYNISAILTSTYMHSCHQQPDRSFWMLGYPIALCCRCYGFYLGVAISTIVGLFIKFNINIKIFLSLLIITTVDICLNYFFKINTGNITKFIVGIIMGCLFTTALCYTMNFLKEKKIYEY